MKTYNIVLNVRLAPKITHLEAKIEIKNEDKKKHLSYVANNIKEVHLKEKFLNMLATPSTNEKGYVTDSYEFFLNKNEKELDRE